MGAAVKAFIRASLWRLWLRYVSLRGRFDSGSHGDGWYDGTPFGLGYSGWRSPILQRLYDWTLR